MFRTISTQPAILADIAGTTVLALYHLVHITTKHWRIRWRNNVQASDFQKELRDNYRSLKKR